MLKAMLCMANKTLIPCAGFRELNPRINLADSPLYVIDQCLPWDESTTQSLTKGVRRAGVSSFGSGGANAHVVLEEYSNADSGEAIGDLTGNEPAKDDWRGLFVLSAKNHTRLVEYARRYLDWLASPVGQACVGQDLFYTLQLGREEMSCRLAIRTEKREDLVTGLTQYCNDPTFSKGLSGRIYVGDLSSDQRETMVSDDASNHSNDGWENVAAKWVQGHDFIWRDVRTELAGRNSSAINA